MTDEERQKLCVRLRMFGTGVYDAADEIERLVKERLRLLERIRQLEGWHNASQDGTGSIGQAGEAEVVE
jgi:hypothetical protein